MTLKYPGGFCLLFSAEGLPKCGEHWRPSSSTHTTTLQAKSLTCDLISYPYMLHMDIHNEYNSRQRAFWIGQNTPQNERIQYRHRTLWNYHSIENSGPLWASLGLSITSEHAGCTHFSLSSHVLCTRNWGKLILLLCLRRSKMTRVNRDWAYLSPGSTTLTETVPGLSYEPERWLHSCYHPSDMVTTISHISHTASSMACIITEFLHFYLYIQGSK